MPGSPACRAAASKNFPSYVFVERPAAKSTAKSLLVKIFLLEDVGRRETDQPGNVPSLVFESLGPSSGCPTCLSARLLPD
jgi:hypothetical protein